MTGLHDTQSQFEGFPHVVQAHLDPVVLLTQPLSAVATDHAQLHFVIFRTIKKYLAYPSLSL